MTITSHRDIRDIDVDFLSIDVNDKCILISIRYVIEGDDRTEFEALQKSLKLYKSGKTGILFAVTSGGVNKQEFLIFNPNPFYGKELYSLGKKDLRPIRNYYDYFLKSHNTKLGLLFEKFLYALSGEKIENSTRIIELVSLLEMLYLPKSDSEKRFRISVSVSRMLYRVLREDKYSLYKKMRNLYDIRSSLVHTGNFKKVGKYDKTQLAIDDLETLVRESMKLFVKNKELFSEIGLEKLFLS
jgi:hypothetical protein